MVTETGEEHELKQSLFRELVPYPRYTPRYWWQDRVARLFGFFYLGMIVEHLISFLIEVFFCDWELRFMFDPLGVVLISLVWLFIIGIYRAAENKNYNTFKQAADLREEEAEKQHWLVMDDLTRVMANMKRRQERHGFRDWWIVFVTNRRNKSKRTCTCCLLTVHGFRVEPDCQYDDQPGQSSTEPFYNYTSECPFCGWKWM